MKMTNAGKKFLTELEGVKNHMYYDSKGYATIGIGHLIDMVTESHLMTKILTNEEIYELLDKDLQTYEDCVQETCGSAVYSAYKNDALVSICYNIGKAGFRSSTFAKRINAMESDDRIVAAIMQWTADWELHGRRTVEARLFKEGNYYTGDKGTVDWAYLKG